jgi:molecular chaperone DnaJ
VNGTTKKLKIGKFVTCDACGGSGARTSSGVEKCKTCNGAGVVTEVVDSFFGRTQTQRACPACQGTGEVVTDPCTKCKGEGIVRGEEIVEIKIPAGVGEGMQLSVSGKGNAARRGGINGDLLVVIEEERDPQLVRDGNDLLHNHKISIPTALLGGTVEVPTVEGRAKVKVAPGTTAGSVLRLRGKGIPDLNGRGRGDILVVVDIDVPSKLSAEERKAVEGLAQSPAFKNPDNSRPEQNIFERMRNFFR